MYNGYKLERLLVYIFFIIMLFFLGHLLFSGLNFIAQNYETNKVNAMEELFVTGKCTYYRDTVTDVMWIKYKNNLTMILDPNTGLPLTYSDYLEIADTNTRAQILAIPEN